MRAHIVNEGVVVNTIEVASLDFMPDLVVAVGNEGVGWFWDGQNFFPPVDPEKTIEQVKKEIVASVQERLDKFAQGRNYDGILSACTYATSTIPTFAVEGQCCIGARDSTWAKLYEILAEVESGARPIPSGYADIEAKLPVLVWPN